MSVSSLEGSPVPSDLAAKYQKIASEYAKIRAQFGVLKKAVVDEQSHSAELKETLRIKDLNLRKAEQEIDSLSFRNQHLMKRVTILQDELDAVQNSGKKGKIKGPSRDIPNSILAEELEKKISENAHLASMLQEQSDKYESEKFKLIQSQEMFEHELEECKKLLANVEETKLSKLENENKQLLSKLSAKEESLQKLNNEIKVLKNKASERGVEPESEDWREKFVKFLQNLGIEELLRTAVVLFRNLENGYLKSADEAASENLSKSIESNITAVGSFIASYSSYCGHISNGGDISSAFDSIGASVDNYLILLDELGVHLLSGDGEVNQIFKDLISRLKSHWIQFQSAIKYVTCVESPADNEECATTFADIFRSLRSTCDYFSSCLTDMRVESKELSVRDVLSTLGKIGAQSGVIYKKITENKFLIKNAFDYQPLKPREKETEVEEECCQLWKEKYETMNAAHLKKIKDLEEQISCLSGSGTPQSSHSGHTSHSPAEGKEKVSELPNMIASDPKLSRFFGAAPGPSSFSGRWENQEAELTKYFNARANTLIADRQFAESKVTALKSECEALQKRLEHSIECRELLEASVQQSQDTVARLQEELATTTSNYEIQLSSLSEHMANMNDKLAAQQEEIDVLNYQLSEKNSKKGKSK